MGVYHDTDSVYQWVTQDEMNLRVLGVGALQVMLDKGQEDDWFGSQVIVPLAVIASMFLVSPAR